MEEAKKARTIAKRLFTIAVKSLQTLVTSSPTITQINKAMDRMEEMYDRIISANDEVIISLSEDCSESEVEENMNYVAEVDKVRAEVTTVMSKLISEKMKEDSPTQSMSPSPVLNQPVKCQLERLKVQQFAGNMRDYPSWKLSFEHCMYKYCPDEDERLQRLKEAVLPPVRKEVAHCLSMKSAMEILDQGYGNEDELMTLLLHDIKSLQPIKYGNFKNLKSFAADIRAFITRVKDLGKDCDLKADYLLVDIMEKLPREDQYKFKVYCRDKEKSKSLESLAKWLSEEAQLRHIVTDEQKKPGCSTSISSNTASAKTENNESTRKNQSCLIECTDSHLLKDCPIFTSKNVAERWEIVKLNKCCFCCLKRGHHTQICYEKKSCPKPNCNKNHHVLLHLDSYPQPPISTSAINVVGCGQLPVVKIKVFDDYGVSHSAVAMIDSGSQQSLVKKAFTNRLRLKSSRSQDLEIQLAGGGGHIERSSNYDLKVAADEYSPIYNLDAMSLETVCGDVTPIDKEALKKHPHLTGIASKAYLEGGKVDLLIGTNFPTAFKETGSCYTADQNAPIAKQTPLGWILLGDLNDVNHTPYVNHVSVVSEPNIAKMFEIDSLGVKPTRACTCSDDELAESAFIEHFKESVRFQSDGRLEMKMPWKPGHPSFPDNRPMAKKRLYSLEKKLIQSEKVDVYNEEIQKLVDDGFCVKLKSTEIDWSKPFWLLPHHAVERPDASSTRVRVVFDSAAQYDGICLNDALEKGPNYLNDLFKVLIGRRQDEIAYCGDIRKMFNMIAIHPDDQPYHRFLWRDCDTSKQPDVYQWTRLSFGNKSSPDLACSGIRLLAKESEAENPYAKDALTNHIYIDDVADSTEDVGKAQITISEIDKVLQHGRFSVKAWHSNNELIDQAPDDKVITILGHKWDKENDMISLKTKDFSRIPNKLTKRTVFNLPFDVRHPVILPKNHEFTNFPSLPQRNNWLLKCDFPLQGGLF